MFYTDLLVLTAYPASLGVTFLQAIRLFEKYLELLGIEFRKTSLLQ